MILERERKQTNKMSSYLNINKTYHSNWYETETINKLLKECRNYKRLTNDETLDLIANYQNNNDKIALDTLVKSNIKFIFTTARCYTSYPIEDVMSAAIIGFITAINKFDITKDVKLSTYASWQMKYEISNYLYKEHSIIRQPYNIASSSSAPVIKYDDIIELEFKVSDINTPEYSTKYENIVDNNDLILDNETNNEVLNIINDIIYVLSEKEKYIIENRFGLSGYSPISNIQIAASLNTKPSYTSFAYKNAIEKLRNELIKKGIDISIFQ